MGKYSWSDKQDERRESRRSVPVKKPVNIKPLSDKRQKMQVEYRKIVKEMLSENKMCEMKIPGVCTGAAEGLDHIQKRTSKNLLERTNLRRACNACNLSKENHPKLADQLGLTKSRFIPDGNEEANT